MILFKKSKPVVHQIINQGIHNHSKTKATSVAPYSRMISEVEELLKEYTYYKNGFNSSARLTESEYEFLIGHKDRDPYKGYKIPYIITSEHPGRLIRVMSRLGRVRKTVPMDLDSLKLSDKYHFKYRINNYACSSTYSFHSTNNKIIDILEYQFDASLSMTVAMYFDGKEYVLFVPYEGNCINILTNAPLYSGDSGKSRIDINLFYTLFPNGVDKFNPDIELWDNEEKGLINLDRAYIGYFNNSNTYFTPRVSREAVLNEIKQELL